MSPASRRRKNPKSTRSDLRIVRPAAPATQECDCPACSGDVVDMKAFIDDLAADAAEIRTADDPIEAELFGAGFLAAGEMAGDGFAEALTEGILPALTQMATPESLTMLLAIGAVHHDTRITDAAQHLRQTGLPDPTWLDALTEPITCRLTRRYRDPTGESSMLLCAFERTGHTHGFLIHVDHTDCDAAADLILFPGEALDQVHNMIEADARQAGITLDTDDLPPAELRWHIERALNARAVHEREDPEPDDDPDPDDGPGYHTLAILLQARMNTLPEPPRPPAAHGETTGL